MHDYIIGSNKHFWGQLLLEVLKETGKRGMTLNEIHATFPSKSERTIVSMLYHRKIPRKAFTDKKTGKCKKVYYYPSELDVDWREQVNNLLATTKNGLSLTDLLLETGVHKKDIKEYLYSVQNLKKVETGKKNWKSLFYPIERFYIGDREIKLRKDEELAENIVNGIKQRQTERKYKAQRIKEIMGELIKTKRRFTLKEVSNLIQEDLTCEASVEATLWKRAKEEGYKSEFVYGFGNLNEKERHSYRIYYAGKEVPLNKGEMIASEFPIFLRSTILEAIRVMRNPDKKNIKTYVGNWLGYVSAGAMDGWGGENIPDYIFNITLKSLIDQKKIRRIRKRREKGVNPPFDYYELV